MSVSWQGYPEPLMAHPLNLLICLRPSQLLLPVVILGTLEQTSSL